MDSSVLFQLASGKVQRSSEKTQGRFAKPQVGMIVETCHPVEGWGNKLQNDAESDPYPAPPYGGVDEYVTV